MNVELKLDNHKSNHSIGPKNRKFDLFPESFSSDLRSQTFRSISNDVSVVLDRLSREGSFVENSFDPDGFLRFRSSSQSDRVYQSI